ncbi:2-succinyl-5-enolpyruvyl-6-hydroxy-3-cyclohexene-1-carboxylic-acid synthase [Halorientalis sp. IM1011]|uniref:2-succinyl-5-enolpyruvyl-6-hydroxy-3- cyclohexene-1-carboxylic-acid synthase n=1 Tax=Halorientalis sp. IM1011 TaxID=1932360 RepID=UPI00097CC86C|nr:2-succinyl-5-enolpyruvyl-6-hydroxy-3-cyclohexene-1-carboxylic-acid synthase [Halorientalis sp. IM1011]AQL41558.1 2-succinyl-5-enolpyruvyl-6-hydroxy-3-cyclohexene-1-carboxylic-acid synthase [Halorientalis sp. IM1011]
MVAPNRNTLWGRVIADELAKAEISGAVLCPGSRSTPLTVAISEHDDIETFSVLDERSAAFFALGRARRTGEPTAVVCTSGTAAANFHPAVIEASQSRVPLLLLTADRPPELGDSGANQTVDQEKLYGDAVRWYRTLPEPEPRDRKLRSLRTTIDRAVGETTGVPAGPVHLNCPFRKPLEPVEVEGDVPADLAERAPLAVEGRDGPFVERTAGRPELTDGEVDDVAAALRAADRGLLVAGPADAPDLDADAVADLAAATGFPILADPLSGLRFGDHLDRDGVTVCGGYDSYLNGAGDWPAPEVVVRLGASPTSKVLRQYLRDYADRQFVVDPAGGWREAEFTATDHLVAHPSRLAAALAERIDTATSADGYRERFEAAERDYWNLIDEARAAETFEGQVLATVAERAPDPATVFVSNSMPVRDLDRFGRPRGADLTILGNRGASGIDGVTSTALGAGSAADDPLVLVTGDLAYYHDTNGLLSIARCGVDATIVLVNNDGGGIFHLLPIEEFDPPFTEQFRTPHGLDFESTADLYDLEFQRVRPDDFAAAFEESQGMDGAQVIEVVFDSESSHRTRETIHERVRRTLHGE